MRQCGSRTCWIAADGGLRVLGAVRLGEPVLLGLAEGLAEDLQRLDDPAGLGGEGLKLDVGDG